MFASCGGSTLLSIAVTPTNPSITKAGALQFIATATYSDNTTKDITADVTWSSGTETVATISTAGLATGVSINYSTSVITATLGAVSGTTNLTVDPIYVSECTPVSAGFFLSAKNFLTLNTSNLISTTGTASYLSADCSGGVDLYVVSTLNTENAVPATTGASFGDADLFAIEKIATKFEAYGETDAGIAAANAMFSTSYTKGVWIDVTHLVIPIETSYSWFKIYNSDLKVSSVFGSLTASEVGEASLADLIAAGDPVVLGEQVDYVLNTLTASEWLPAR